MTPTLSPRALLRAAYDQRRLENPGLTMADVAEAAGMPPPRISEALAETVPCPACSGSTGKPHARCKVCAGKGRVVPGEPRPETVERILRALGFAMALVDVRKA